MTFTKVSGKTTNLMATEGTFGTPVITMKVNIRTENVMDMVSMFMQVVVAIQANGKMISSMGKVLIRNLMDSLLLVSSSREK